MLHRCSDEKIIIKKHDAEYLTHLSTSAKYKNWHLNTNNNQLFISDLKIETVIDKKTPKCIKSTNASTPGVFGNIKIDVTQILATQNHILLTARLGLSIMKKRFI